MYLSNSITPLLDDKVQIMQDDTSQLGPFIARFEPDWRGLRSAFVTFLVLFLGIGGIFISGGPFPKETVWYKSGAVITLLILATLIALGTIASLIFWIRMSRHHVELYRDGLRFNRATESEVYPWDDIDTIWRQSTQYVINGVPGRIATNYTLKRRDGKNLQLRGYHFQVKLNESIHCEMTPRLLSRAEQQLAAGTRINFGEVELDREGLHYRNKTLVWPDVYEAFINNGYLYVCTIGNKSFFQREAGKVPNADIFLSLVMRMKPEQNSDGN